MKEKFPYFEVHSFSELILESSCLSCLFQDLQTSVCKLTREGYAC